MVGSRASRNRLRQRQRRCDGGVRYATRTLLELWLLGRVHATFEGSPLKIAPRKALALLAYLAVQGGTHHRDALASLLWPEQDQTRALASLRQALYTLGNSVAQDVIDRDGQTLRIASDSLRIDVKEFDALIAKEPGDRVVEAPGYEPVGLERAVELYRGDFMQGFTLRDCPAFDEWQYHQAETYRQRCRGALRSLTAWYAEAGRLERAIAYGRALVALDPLDQSEHRRLMLLYALADHEAAAIRQYEALAKRLADDLSIEPDEETTEVYQAIKRREVHLLLGRTPGDAQHAALARLLGGKPRAYGIDAPHAFLPGPRTNLPARPTELVGRQGDVRSIGDLLATPAARMITIVAPGGMGKTSVALAVAEQQVAQGSFRDGVFFVPLTSVRSVDFLPQAIADALQMKLLGSDDPSRQLVQQVSEHSMLLVLDSFERLLSGAGLVSDLLANAPELKVLVTSRARLHAQEEWLYQLWGLEVPSAAHDVVEMRNHGAVELFERCATKADPQFDLSRSGREVVRICRLLQGMPLGIELAAAWVATIPCRDIAVEIERDLGFLDARARPVTDQHRSLQAVFEYTWSQASEQVRSTFQRLSVFRGGFTRHAAEQVAGATLSILASLTDMALIRLRDSGRYDIHELLRQFAEAKLEMQPNEHQGAQRASALYFADMLARLEPDLESARQFEALADIAADIDNVLTSWHWATRHRDSAVISTLAMGFLLFCEMRGLAQLGSEVFQGAIDSLADSGSMDGRSAATLAKLRVGHAVLRMRTGDDPKRLFPDRTDSLHSLSVDEPRAYVYCINWVATGLPYEGRHAEAGALLDRAEVIALGDDDTFGMAWLLQTRGHNSYIAGRLTEAEPFFERSLSAFDACGDRKFKALGLNNWSRTALKLGFYDRAASLNAEGLAIRRMAEDPLGVAASSIVRGRLMIHLGQYTRARRHLDQAARSMQRSSNYQYWWMLELEELQLDIELGNTERAHTRFQQSRPRYGQYSDPYSNVQRLIGSAHLSYLRNDFEAARSLLDASLSMSDDLGHLHNMARALHHLGFVDLAEGNLRAARDSFARALDVCRATGAAPLALATLMGWSELEAGTSRIELLALVRQDARAAHHTREAARHKLLELEPSDRVSLDLPDLWQLIGDLA